MTKESGASSGSRASAEPVARLGPAGFDPARDDRLCGCYDDDEEGQPLTLRQLPGGDYLMLCDECGLRVIDDDPKTFRELAEAAIMDLRHYAEDELPHRRLVSATAYEKRFQLIASADTHPTGGDTTQIEAPASLSGAVGAAETPDPGSHHPKGTDQP